ncbi:hypothetical protein FA10DRAFT_300515 [Acaromyces ingoldii]|uniref:Uncharacterized protein n=1 Tax=Acaromyces ingoldii TaxID=215250 RepID=A0A316YW07_9BASI|nr:hypothetical protein FA10DRAFT_300515 [Acaromyces ingoldii]PWN91955.1 hypothetical protein FA10DRAFT_300515 [Acaromyces ingoldii]
MKLPLRIFAVLLVAIIVLNLASTKPVDAGARQDDGLMTLEKRVHPYVAAVAVVLIILISMLNFPEETQVESYEHKLGVRLDSGPRHYPADQHPAYERHPPYQQPPYQQPPYHQQPTYHQQPPYQQHPPYHQQPPYQRHAPYHQQPPYQQHPPYHQQPPYQQPPHHQPSHQNPWWNMAPHTSTSSSAFSPPHPDSPVSSRVSNPYDEFATGPSSAWKPFTPPTAWAPDASYSPSTPSGGNEQKSTEALEPFDLASLFKLLPPGIDMSPSKSFYQSVVKVDEVFKCMEERLGNNFNLLHRIVGQVDKGESHLQKLALESKEGLEVTVEMITKALKADSIIIGALWADKKLMLALLACIHQQVPGGTARKLDFTDV